MWWNIIKFMFRSLMIWETAYNILIREKSSLYKQYDHNYVKMYIIDQTTNVERVAASCALWADVTSRDLTKVPTPLTQVVSSRYSMAIPVLMGVIQFPNLKPERKIPLKIHKIFNPLQFPLWSNFEQNPCIKQIYYTKVGSWDST